MSRLKAEVIGKGDNPHTIDSDQLLRWRHHLGASGVLASVNNRKQVWPELSRRDKADTLYDNRWVLTKFSLDGDNLPRTLLIALVVSAENLGTGLLVGWRGDSPGLKVGRQIMKLAETDAFRIDFTTTLEGDKGEQNLHLIGVHPVLGAYNPALIRDIDLALAEALREASANSEGDVVRWKDLPKVWKLWLARNNYRRLMFGALGFHVRHDNGLSSKTVNSPAWEAPNNLALRRRDLERAALALTLKLVGLTASAEREARTLRKVIKKARPGKTLLEVATEDQGDYTPPGKPVPHFCSFAYKMLSGVEID